MRRWVVAVLAIALSACGRGGCGKSGAAGGKGPVDPDGSAADWASGTTFLAADRWFKDLAVDHDAELIAVTRDDAEVVRIPKSGAPATTLARYGTAEDVRAIAVAGDSLLVLVGERAVETREKVVRAPFRLVAIPLGGGAAVPIENDVGRRPVLRAHGDVAWTVHERNDGKTSALARRRGPGFAAESNVIERGSIQAFVADDAGAFWLESTRDGDGAFRLFTSSDGAAPRVLATPAPPLRAFSSMHSGGDADLFPAALDADAVYVASAWPPAEGSANPALAAGRGDIHSFDRTTGAAHVIAVGLAVSGAIVAGGSYVCVPVFGSPMAYATPSALVAVPKEGGTLKSLAVDLWNGKCLAADATSFYAISFGGRRGIARIPLPR